MRGSAGFVAEGGGRRGPGGPPRAPRAGGSTPSLPGLPSGDTYDLTCQNPLSYPSLDNFYKGFAEGRYYPAYRMEMNAARKRGLLR